MNNAPFTPKLFSLLRKGIKKEQLVKDLTSGLVVGIVALPLAIAFAIASGVSPDKGLITAIIAGLVISILGGSRVQIGGPTGAFIVLVYAIVQEHGVIGLTIATFMAGLIMIVMGLARLGNLLKFIPYPLVVGFTSGIAVIIFSSQIKDFLGLPILHVPSEFLEKWQVYAMNFSQINWIAVAIGTGTVLISLNSHRISKKIPGSLIAILLSTLAVHWFNLPVTTIESSFGDIPNHLSLPTIPHIDYGTIKALIQPAFAIALLGGLESLLSAVVADGMIGGQHRSNAELVAQGTANCFSALFGGIPATGAIARTATNIKNGGRTPIAGITHSIVLLVIMLLLAPFAKLIPMACLSGILVVVAYHMSEWKQFKLLLKGSRSDILILLTTFFLTIIFDLIVAIEIGMVLSSFVLMKRMSESLNIEDATGSFERQNLDYEELFEDEIPGFSKDVSFFEINGPLFFGVAQTFHDTINQLQEKTKVLVLRMRHVPFIDATGIHRLKELIVQLERQKTTVLLSGVNARVRADLQKHEFYTVLGEDHILDSIEDTIHLANDILSETKE